MPVITLDVNGTAMGDNVDASELGGEYLGWTGMPGWENQAEHLGIHHIRWPAGIVAEDRIEPEGYAFDISQPNLIDNWPRSDGQPRPGPADMFAYAIETDASFAMIIPSARYAEIMRDDPEAARAWIRSDIEAFTTRLFAGDWGTIPADFTLEIGAEYYSTDAWAAMSGDPNTEDYFAEVFAELVAALSDAESANGSDIYRIAVQASRFQSNGDTADTQDGEAQDSAAFIAAYQSAAVEDAIDALIWHRYVYTFDQISHHLSPTPVAEHTLLDEVALWEAALGRPLETLVGWASPDIDSQGASTTDPFFDYGPRSAHNLLQMFAQLSASGTDRASIYGIDVEWTGALSTGSTSPNDFQISYMGEVFALMTQSLPGLTGTDVFLSNSVFVDTQNGILESDHANIFTFSDFGARQVTYVALRDLSSPDISISINAPSDFTAEFATLRHLRPNDNGPDAGGHLISPDVTLTNGRIAVHGLTDFDVVEASFLTNATGLGNEHQTTVSLETGRSHLGLSVGADTFELVESADRMIDGLGGDDAIRGSYDADILIGNLGDDVLDGGGGDDILIGDDVSDETILHWLQSGEFNIDVI